MWVTIIYEEPEPVIAVVTFNRPERLPVGSYQQGTAVSNLAKPDPLAVNVVVIAAGADPVDRQFYS